jgi:hypothetical protein
VQGIAAKPDRADWAMYISSRLKIFLSIYFFVCIGIFVLCTAHWKQVNDPAQLSYLCFLMDHGMAPYRDLLEINMPGIYLVNWSVMHLLGEGSFAWRIFDFSLMGAAAWAMIVIARPYDWLAGVLGATLFALYHGRDGAGQAGQRDFIIAVLLLCAYAFLFEFFRHRREWAIFAFGVCAGVAATIKPTPLPFVFLILVLAVIHLKRTGEPTLRPSVYALLGLLVPFALVCTFLVSKHSVGSFWYLLHVELPFYKSLGRLPFPTLMTLVASASVRTLALIALAIALLRWQGWNWESKLLVTGIIFGIASFFGQGKGFPYLRLPDLWIGTATSHPRRTPAILATISKEPSAGGGCRQRVIPGWLWLRKARVVAALSAGTRHPLFLVRRSLVSSRRIGAKGLSDLCREEQPARIQPALRP